MTASPNGAPDKSLGEIVSEVSEKASQLVREEIELAKSEVAAKAKSLGRGAAIAIAAGVFGVFGVVMLLHTFAWLLVDAFDLAIWVGFGIVTLLLFVFAAIAGLVAAKLISRGAPPTPDMAIEEARLVRESLDPDSEEHEQLERSKQADKAQEARF